jgi:hypothetical protein
MAWLEDVGFKWNPLPTRLVACNSLPPYAPGRAQIWFRDPDKKGNATVFAAALDPDSPTDWGPREERRASPATLETILKSEPRLHSLVQAVVASEPFQTK